MNEEKPEDKAIPRFNAVKHGILRASITEYEQEFYAGILKDLEEDYQPQSVIEQILLERLAINYLKLFRVQKAETEFMKAHLNPSEYRTEGGIDYNMEEYIGKTVLVKEGYSPVVKEEQIQVLMNTFGRYETTIENRLFRTLHELERAQSVRKGIRVPQPLVVDINNTSSFGETTPLSSD
jgi:hypothetical protein